MGVERRGGFIAQQHRRVGGQRPGDTDPLLLPSRQLIRVAVHFVAQVDKRQQLRNPRLDKGLVAALQNKRDSDVMKYRFRIQQIKILKDHADIFFDRLQSLAAAVL